MKLGIYIDSWQQKDFDLGCLNMRAFLPTPLGIVSVSRNGLQIRGGAAIVCMCLDQL